LYEHEAESPAKESVGLGGIQRGGVWLIAPDIAHAKSIAMIMQGRCDRGSYALGSIDTANTVGSGEYVAGEGHNVLVG